MTHAWPVLARYSSADLLALLARWEARGWLRAIDLELVRFVERTVGAIDPGLALAVALTSHQLGRGHVCLDLASALAEPARVLSLPPDEIDAAPDAVTPEALLEGLSLAAWQVRLRHPEVVGEGAGTTPLVLRGSQLYLRRYWRYERQVEAAITARLRQAPLSIDAAPMRLLRTTLDALFAPGALLKRGDTASVAAAPIDWQKVACALAARSAFTVITGGPGTGKTTTVIRVLALLQRLALAAPGGRPARIRMAAPTGKAAARLQASVTQALHALPAFVHDTMYEDQPLRAFLPAEVTTLHRLLGALPDTRAFRHDARHPLPLDVLVVDEASMVDLDTMAAVMAALPPGARLMLLGDKDQLASVEAGSVLGQLCARAAEGHYRHDTAAWVEAATGERLPDAQRDAAGMALDQHVVMLRESRRFDADSGIGQLARAVNAGDGARMRACLEAGDDAVAHWVAAALDEASVTACWLGSPEANAAWPGVRAYLHALHAERPDAAADQAMWDQWAMQVLRARERFQLLCPLRGGAFGVLAVNQHIERVLATQGLIARDAPWYEGRPVLVTRNDYGVGLMNGDMGVALRVPVLEPRTGERRLALRAAFWRTDASGGVRWISPMRLQAIETVYAMTVHKSQGSEFDHVAMLLPPTSSPLLTRELVYTGMTRARRWFSLISMGSARSAEHAITQTVQRSGGLFLA